MAGWQMDKIVPVKWSSFKSGRLPKAIMAVPERLL